MSESQPSAGKGPPANRPSDSSYRWAVLAAGVLAQAAAATILQGLPGLGPDLVRHFGLTLTGLGIVLASGTTGLLLTLMVWGLIADRIGERWTMTAGLVLSAGALLGAASADDARALSAWLVAAGAAGASVNAAGGRAVLAWFPRVERGLAMGVRQTAIPLGAAVASVTLPLLAAGWGLDWAFRCMAIACLAAAVVVALLVREASVSVVAEDGPQGGAESGADADRRSRSRGVTLLCGVSLFLTVPQVVVVGFLVVYLAQVHGMSGSTAAHLLAAVQLVGGTLRIVLGWWSDRLGRRIAPLGAVALLAAALFAALALADAAGWGIAAAPLMVLAGAVAVSWNGLAFTAVGELAAPSRVGLVLGVQNTAVAGGMALTPPLVGGLVDRTSWAVAFTVASLAAVTARLLLAGMRTGRGAHGVPPVQPPPPTPARARRPPAVQTAAAPAVETAEQREES